MKLPIFSLVLLAVLISNPVRGDLAIDQTYSTGYSNGVALAPGAADPDFTLYSAIPGQAPVTSIPVVASPVPAVWVMTSGAQFISPTENQAYPSTPPEGNAPGVYDYQALLTTDFSVPTTLTISGAFGADNAATAYVNGFSMATDPAPGYQALVDFNYAFTEAAGPQTISVDFVVNNQNDTDGTINPTGVIVSGLSVSDVDVVAAAPEPRSWLLMTVGIGAFVFLRRIRRVAQF
jgi:hypothetical protein